MSKPLVATVRHGYCTCDCGKMILINSEFIIDGGEFFLAGHDTNPVPRPVFVEETFGADEETF